MYLLDTDVLSESRKGARVNAGVRRFFERTDGQALFISVLTIGEIRRGVELVRHRGDELQARRIEKWLEQAVEVYKDRILPLNEDCAQLWGRCLRVPNPENAIDKLVAATALIHGLTVVTRNTAHFAGTGVRLLNPFTA